MLKKVISLILTVSVVLSISSCSKVKKSGKPYINRSENFADGLNYWTEEDQTDNFIAFKSPDGEVMLYAVNAKKPLTYNPDGLCDIKPGEIYKIRYDAQHISGGVAGVMKAYFLAVYDCRKADINTLFENGYGKRWSGWSNTFLITPSVEGNDFIALQSEEGGFDLFSEAYGKRHYDEIRNIKFPLEFENDETVEMQFNVFCNKELTDEYITGCILSRNTSDEEGFLFIDADHPGESNDTDYDSINKASVGSLYLYNMMRIKSDVPVTEETRRLITYEEMMEKTAGELGLDNAVYDQIYSGWKSMQDGEFEYAGYHTEPPKNCDILLFGGSFTEDVNMKYDSNLKIQISDWNDNEKAPKRKYQYVALFIKCEFNDLLPQD